MRVTKIQTNLYNLNVANPNLSAPAYSGGGGGLIRTTKLRHNSPKLPLWRQY